METPYYITGMLDNGSASITARIKAKTLRQAVDIFRIKYPEAKNVKSKY